MIEILFEDEDLVIVNKPAGIPSQATVDPKRPSMESLVRQQLQLKKIYLHHRLDRDTTGVLLLSKSSRPNGKLTEMFQQHSFRKKYMAIAAKTHAISTNHSWIVENHLAPVRDAKKKLMRMVVVKKGGWLAHTEFQLVDENENAYLIVARPTTGRTHQIRVHLAQGKNPILGDPLYGGGAVGKSLGVKRCLLHACELNFSHPLTGSVMTISAPVPDDFRLIFHSASCSNVLSD